MKKPKDFLQNQRMKRIVNLPSYKKITMTVPTALIMEYQDILKTIGMNLSSRVSLLMGQDIKNLREVRDLLFNVHEKEEKLK